MRLHAVASSLVLFCLSLAAQTPDTVTLRGAVTDPTHAFVAGARVSATNELTRLVRETSTDAKGEFALSGLPAAGLYDVVVSKDGFTPAHASHVNLAGGSSAKLTLMLGVAGTEPPSP